MVGLNKVADMKLKLHGTSWIYGFTDLPKAKDLPTGVNATIILAGRP